jgi:hypothetical protein
MHGKTTIKTAYVGFWKLLWRSLQGQIRLSTVNLQLK